jgi:predicted ester cyclase
MNTRREVLSLGFLGGAALLAPNAIAAGVCADGGATGSALLDRYIAAVNARDTGAFAEFTAESYIQNSGRSPNGLPALVETFRGIFARMPDVQMRAEDRIVAGDRVAARMVFAATHTQPLQGVAPTGRRFELRTIDIWRIENGKFAEHWDIVDVAGLVKQLRGE